MQEETQRPGRKSVAKTRLCISVRIQQEEVSGPGLFVAGKSEVGSQ
jgi:hypothetical protein